MFEFDSAFIIWQIFFYHFRFQIDSTFSMNQILHPHWNQINYIQALDILKKRGVFTRLTSKGISRILDCFLNML